MSTIMSNHWNKEKFADTYGQIVWSRENKQQKSYEMTAGNYTTYVEVQEGVPILRFSCFDGQKDWMGMGFSTRLGGVSEGCLSELNLGWNRGDLEENVRQNYRLVCKGLGVEAERLVFSDQIHDTKIVYATEEHMAGEALEKKVRGVDGLITDRAGLVLATSYADCVPLFFADVKHHAIASCHSGWRGTVGEIGRKTVEAMQRQFQTRPEELICLVGPSICQDCYEVSEDVVEQFRSVYPEQQCREIVGEGREAGKYQLDLWAACFFTLQKAGVPPEAIHVSRVCTCCHSELLFSHRASGGKRGNLNGFIWKTA